MRLFAVGHQPPDRARRAARVASTSRARGLEPALAALAARGVGARSRSCSRPATAPRSTRRRRRRARPTPCGRFISDYHGVAVGRAGAARLRATAAPRRRDHLFRVAAGLDSLVVGEPQILGQVKDAYATASGVKSTGALTNRLFTSAFTVGKRVRTETGLGEGAVSVSYAAIALAKKIFGDLKGLDVLILGAGEMAKLTGVHLQAQHVQPADDREPHAARPREALAGTARRPRGRRGRELDERWPPPTSSSPRPARPSRC